MDVLVRGKLREERGLEKKRERAVPSVYGRAVYRRVQRSEIAVRAVTGGELLFFQKRNSARVGRGPEQGSGRLENIDRQQGRQRRELGLVGPAVRAHQRWARRTVDVPVRRYVQRAEEHVQDHGVDGEIYAKKSRARHENR